MMLFDPYRVYQYFKENYVLGKKSPKGWWSFDCPFCSGEKKMAVNIEWGYTKCWSCGAASNVCTFVEETEQCSYQDAKRILWNIKPSSLDLDILQEIQVEKRNNEITLPDGWQSILDGRGSLGDRARRYLTSRGYDIEELDFKGFGYCNKHYERPGIDDAEKSMRDFFGYIIVPFKKDGVLSYYLGRDYIGNYLRYKNPPSDWVGVGKADVIYNEEALHLYKTVYTVEGWSDAEAIGKRGTATLGWSLSRVQMDKYHKSQASSLVFIPDAGTDAATGQTYYQKAVQTAMKFLESSKKIFVVDLNVPELDHIKNAKGERAKDVSEIGWPVVKERVRNHTEQLTWNLAMNIITK